MTRYLLLISSICSLFVLSWCLSRWFNPVNCINSSLVGKVVIYPDNDELQTCDLETRLFALNVSKYIQHAKIIERIERLEKIVPFVSAPEQKIKVKVFRNQQNLLIFKDDQLLLSHDVLLRPGTFEKSLLFYQINQSNPFTASIISEFLWSEILELSSNPNPRPWVSYLRSLKSYCLSNDLLLIHFDFCQAHKNLSDGLVVGDDADAVPWSLAPVYTEVLRSIYKNASWSEKKSILDNLLFLGEIEDSFVLNITKWRGPLEAESSLLAQIQDWLMPTLISKSLVEKSFNQHSLAHYQFKFAVVGRSSREYYPLSEHGQWSEGSPASIVQYGKKMAFYPSDVWLDFNYVKVFDQLMVTQLFYVSCDIPEVQTLTGYARVAKKVIYLQQCADEDIDWTQLHQQTIRDYIVNYKDLKFIEFNLSALEFAQKVRGPLQNQHEFGSWQRWLLWQKIITEEESKTMRPLSAIDGVGRYRFQ